MIGIIGFIAGAALTALVWYVKDYTMDSLYCKDTPEGTGRQWKRQGTGSMTASWKV